MNRLARKRIRIGRKKAARAGEGFSLLELVVAMAIFLIVSGTAFSLFNQQQTSALRLQGQTALNVSLRNAAAQLQMDAVNAGSGYYQTLNMPSWPIGITIMNTMPSSGTACNSGTTYGPTCFDTVNIIQGASPVTTYPPIHATDNTGGTSEETNCSTTTTGIAYGQPAVVSGVTWTAAATAAAFQQGDQLLFYNATPTQEKLTSVVLTANPTVVNSVVKFQFNPTASDGSNSLANDPLDITACDSTTGNMNCASYNNDYSGLLGTTFCGTDWIIKLSPITYMVCSGPGSPTYPANQCDTSSTSADIQDPKLVRIQNGTQSTVMEQVIGFRVGGALWSGSNESAESPTYNYQASSYGWNFSLLRAVRISLIGRTAPSDVNPDFQNGFDQGKYQVQGMAVIINPRNMSMNDN